MPLERFHDGGPSGDDERNKQNCTDEHVFNPFENCIEDCAATVVNRMWIFGPKRSFLGVATFLLRWSRRAGVWIKWTTTWRATITNMEWAATSQSVAVSIPVPA